MKCPNCGNELKEGKLYCDRCSHEVRVPEFDHFDDKVQKTMVEFTRGIDWEDVEKDNAASRRKKRKKANAGKNHRPSSGMSRYVIRILLLAILIITAVIGIIMHDRILHEIIPSIKAERYYNSQNYPEAAEQYREAADWLETNGYDDSDKRIKLIKCLYLQGEYIDASRYALDMYEEELEKEEKQQVFQYLIYSYIGADMANEAAYVLEQCDDETLKRAYHDYMVFPPEISVIYGSNDGSVDVRITDEGTGSVFYTIDGSVPDKTGTLYDQPFQLQTGSYTVSAVFINRYGASSKITDRVVIVNKDS